MGASCLGHVGAILCGASCLLGELSVILTNRPALFVKTANERKLFCSGEINNNMILQSEKDQLVNSHPNQAMNSSLTTAPNARENQGHCSVNFWLNLGTVSW